MPKEKEKEKKKGFLRSFISSTASALGAGPKTAAAAGTNAPIRMNLSGVTPKQVGCITRLQAHARGFLVRRAMRISGTRKQQEMQIKSLRLLMRTEQKYVEKLELFIKDYLVPCRELCKGNKKKLKQLGYLFIDVEEVLELHHRFSKAIETYYELWPACQGVIKAVFEMVLEFQMYEKYVNNIPFSKTTFYELKKEKSPIITLILKLDEDRKANWTDTEHVYRDFRRLLKLPMKQLLAYKSPLKKLMISTPESHPDYRFRVAASAIFREIGLYLNFIFKRSLANQSMIILEGRLIVPAKGGFRVPSPNRKIMREGEMFVNDGNAKRIILFNDVCLITATMNKVTYNYEDHFDLKGAKLFRLSTSQDGNSQVFTVAAVDGKSYTFCPASFAKTRSWQKSFEDAISRRNDQVFGLSVSEVVERDLAPIPRIVFAIAYRLNRGLAEDRVFRAAGESRSLRHLRRRFNHHLRDLDLSTSFAPDVAALLLPYLESLPEPIFLLDTHDTIMEGKAAPPEDEILAYFKKRVGELHPANRNLFEFLVMLLHRAALTSASEDSLTQIELSVLFSPCVFRPVDWNLQYCYKMPRIAKSFALVLRNPEKIFDITNDPLPKSTAEFLYADLFGDWWRRFRMAEPKILAFVTSTQNIRAFTQALVVQDRGATSEEIMKQSHGAALACMSLTDDHVKPILFERPELLEGILQLILQHAAGTTVNLRFCRDTLEALFESYPEEMTNFMTSHPELSLVGFMNVGSVSGLLCSIATKSVHYQYPKHHRMLFLWSTQVLQLFLSGQSNSDALLDSGAAFLDIVFTDDCFLSSVYADKLTAWFTDPKNLAALMSKVVSSASETHRVASAYIVLIKSLLTKRLREIPEEDDGEEENEKEEEQEGRETDQSEEPSDSQSSDSSSEENKDEVKTETVLLYPLPNAIQFIVDACATHISSIVQTVTQSSVNKRCTLYDSVLLSLLRSIFATDLLPPKSLQPGQLRALWDLIFQFPSNNIVHNEVASLAVWFASFSNESATILCQSGTPEHTVEQLDATTCFSGQLFDVVRAIVHSDFPDAFKGSRLDWNQLRQKVTEHEELTAPDQVKRRNRHLVTDHCEDRI